jgi:hypothetical protein
MSESILSFPQYAFMVWCSAKALYSHAWNRTLKSLKMTILKNSIAHAQQTDTYERYQWSVETTKQACTVLHVAEMHLNWTVTSQGSGESQ